MSGNGTAVVTGAGTGIGRAVAQALATRGQHVVVTGRREDLLAETVELIAAENGSAESVRLDVTDDAAVEDLFSTLAGRRRVEVVVANAGNFHRAPVAELEPDQWRSQVDVNLTGVFLTLRAAVRVMGAQEPVDGIRGHLFTINSGAGVTGFPTGSAYAAAKHGVRGLVNSLRPEVAPLGITVTDIVVSATVESEMSAGRDVRKLPAWTVGHTLSACLDLPPNATWERVDLGQVER